MSIRELTSILEGVLPLARLQDHSCRLTVQNYGDGGSRWY